MGYLFTCQSGVSEYKFGFFGVHKTNHAEKAAATQISERSFDVCYSVRVGHQKVLKLKIGLCFSVSLLGGRGGGRQMQFSGKLRGELGVRTANVICLPVVKNCTCSFIGPITTWRGCGMRSTEHRLVIYVIFCLTVVSVVLCSRQSVGGPARYIRRYLASVPTGWRRRPACFDV